MSHVVVRGAFAAVLLCVAAALASAQQSTTTTETKAFEVIGVTGNDLVVKLPEGTKELTVAEDFRFTVDGRQLSVHELKPGMKGTAVVTTKTTTLRPVTVTEVKNGTVKAVTGGSMIVQTDQGFKSFSQSDIDKRGIKIFRNGELAQLSDFHAGDQLSATIVTTRAPRAVTEKQVEATLARSAAGAGGAGAAATGGGAGAAASSGAPAGTRAATPSRSTTSASAGGTVSGTAGAAGAAGGAEGGRKLPKTASSVPLIGLVGIASLLCAITLTIRRRGLVR